MGIAHCALFFFFFLGIIAFSAIKQTVVLVYLQGIDYLKYDNCNNDESKPTDR